MGFNSAFKGLTTVPLWTKDNILVKIHCNFIQNNESLSINYSGPMLTWQRLMFRSYGGSTHRNVTSPRDRKMTSHHYSPRRTPLPSPTADPAPEALLTLFSVSIVVTSIHCYNRHVWSYSIFFTVQALWQSATLRNLNPYFLKVVLNIIVPPMPKSTKQSPPSV